MFRTVRYSRYWYSWYSWAITRLLVSCSSDEAADGDGDRPSSDADDRSFGREEEGDDGDAESRPAENMGQHEHGH